MALFAESVGIMDGCYRTQELYLYLQHQQATWESEVIMLRRRE